MRRYDQVQERMQGGDVTPWESSLYIVRYIGLTIFLSILAFSAGSLFGLALAGTLMILAVLGILGFVLLDFRYWLPILSAWWLHREQMARIDVMDREQAGTLPAQRSLLYTTDTDPLHAPSYVAPVDRTAERDALEWARTLYGLDGTPDPRKVVLDTDKEAPGRLRVRKPAGKELGVLLHYRILRPIHNGDRLTGYRLHLGLYPTRGTVEGILLRGRGG